MKLPEYKERSIKIIAKNRKARFEFFITQVFEAGIALQGTEVKSLRNSRCSLQEAYAGFKRHDDQEMYIFNMHIPHYEHGNIQNHEPMRVRKLLLHQREITKLKSAIQEKGMTIIPLAIYFSGHLVKVELGLAKAKKKYDKRETTKKRDTDREIMRKFRT